MSVLDRFGAAVKSVTSEVAAASVPFASHGGYGGGFGTSGYIGSGISGNSPGSTFNYEAEIGDLIDNGIVAACIDAKAQAMASTPPILLQRKGDDWNPLSGHPLIDLLQTPNPNYGDAQLWMAIEAAEFTTGNGYLRGVWNRTRTKLVQLWWEGMVAPRWDRQEFIAGCNLWLEGRPFPLQSAGQQAKPQDREGDCILHFRYALDRRNPRMGWTPLFTVFRQIHGDNAVADYHASLLRNSAVASMVVTPKEGISTVITPKVLEELTAAIERKLQGGGAGRVAGTSLPVDIHMVGYSPDKMAITETLGYFERRVCAAARTHPMVLGLGAGDDFKTYANFQEAIKDFWMRTLIPTQDRRADELETQLFPLFELDRNEYKLSWDRSKIAAIQENEDAMYKRLERAAGGPFLTPNEARGRANLPPKPGGDDLRLTAPPGTMPGLPEGDGAGKSFILIQAGEQQLFLEGRVLKALPVNAFPADMKAGNWEESKHPRGEDGRWLSIGVDMHVTALEPGQPPAFDGTPKPLSTKFRTKEEKGKFGERVIAGWLRSQGAKNVLTHYTSNYPIDLLVENNDGTHAVFECKTGTIDNGKSSQDWRLKIGQPGIDQTALLKDMPADKKKEWNQNKRAQIHERKSAALKEISEQYGQKDVKLGTLAIILDTDRKVADIYHFDGVHDYIGWNSKTTKAAYQGSVRYDDRR